MRPTISTFLSLVTVLVWGVSSSHAIVWNVNTSQTLQAALNTAVAGDEIVLADGTYSGRFTINTNGGTSSQPITVRAANPHQAILEAPNPGCGWQGDNGITVSRSYWTIQDIRMRNQNWGIYLTGVGAHHVTIQNMIIEGYRGGAIMFFLGANNNTAQNNVIGHASQVCGDTGPVADYGVLAFQADTNTIRHNIIFATGNNGYQCADAGGCDSSTGIKSGYGIALEDADLSGGAATHDNVIQGNLLLPTAGKAFFGS
jgi:Chondroitinase B